MKDKIRSIFIMLTVISCLSIVFPSVAESCQRKTLYLHVGPHKTGSSIIQLECTNHFHQLKEYKILYPPSFTSLFEKANDDDGAVWTNHSDLAWMVKKGNFFLVKLYLYFIKVIADEYDSIILSSEDFSPSILMDLDRLDSMSNVENSKNFNEFLCMLLAEYDLKILYVKRDCADRLASASTMLAVTAPDVILGYGTLDSYINHSKKKDSGVENYFKELGALVISYEELKATKKFVSSFLKEGLGIDILMPDRFVNEVGSYSISSKLFSTKFVDALESFYSPLCERTFLNYKNNNIDEAELASRIKELTKCRVRELYPQLDTRPLLN